MEIDFQQGRADSAGVAMGLVKKHRWEFFSFFAGLYGLAQLSGLLWGFFGHGVRLPWLLWEAAPLFDSKDVMLGIGDSVRHANLFLGVSIPYKFSLPGEWVAYAGYFVFDGLVPLTAAIWLYCCFRRSWTPERLMLSLIWAARIIVFTACFFAAAHGGSLTLIP